MLVLLTACASLSAATADGSASATDAATAVATATSLPGAVPGYSQVFADDFTVPAATGSWGTNNASRVVYTGDHGGRWTEYPDGWWPGEASGPYGPSQVLSVHNGVLDFYLHSNSSGQPMGASPSVILASGSQYQTYGMWVGRIKVVYNDSHDLDAYHIAWLLWPKSNARYKRAESDFPETQLDSNSPCAYAHHVGHGGQDVSCAHVDLTQWHTYTQTWGPGYRNYYIDGTLVGGSNYRVWRRPERWQLQIEPTGARDGASGHVLVDWVAVYSRSGA